MSRAKKDSEVSQIRTVTPRKAKKLIAHCMSKKRAVFVWGAPGICKSDLIAEIAQEQSRKVIDMRLLLMAPEDLKGIPYFDSEEGTMRWAPASELPEIVTVEMVAEQKVIADAFEAAFVEVKNAVNFTAAEKAVKLAQALDNWNKAKGRMKRLVGSLEFQNAILFLDEMNSAPQNVQGAAYQLVLNRKIGEYHLPDGVDLVAAGNRDTDKGVTYRQPTPLSNRFIHLNLEVSYEDWQVWALRNGINADIVGFLKTQPHKLFMFDPKSPDKAFATPRSWKFVHDLIDPTLADDELTTLVSGTVGEGVALEFMAHRRLSGQLPDPKEVLDGLVKKLDIKDMSAKYTLTISMCYLLKEYFEKTKKKEMKSDDFHRKFDNYLFFIMKFMEAEMVILGAKTVMKDFAVDINHEKLSSFEQFYEKYGSLVVD